MTKRLLLLLGFAVLAVVLNHSTVYGFNALFSWSDPEFVVLTARQYVPDYNERGTAVYYILLAIKQIIVFGVPVFLFVSGYFIAFAAGRKQPTIKWDVIRARIINLLIPYFIWTMVIFLGQAVVYGRTSSIPVYLQKLIFGQATTAYYYVPLLCQLYVLSPFLVPLAKNNWKLLLTVTAVVQFIVELSHYLDLVNPGMPFFHEVFVYTPLWFFPRRIFWFALGIVFGFHFQEFKPTLLKLKPVFLAGIVVFYILSIVEFETLLNMSGEGWIGSFSTFSNAFYAASVVFSFLLADNLKLPNESFLSDLGTKAYGVYLLNDQVLDLTGTLLFRTAHFILSYQFLYLPIMIAAGLGIPVLLMNLIKKSPARKYYSYLFG